MRVLGLAAALAVIVAWAIPGASANEFERELGQIKLWPDQMCDDSKIVRTIQKRFNWAQRETFSRDITLDDVVEPHEYEFRPTDPGIHDRRFCRATAVLSNGRHHTLYYLISYDKAPPLNGGIEWCIPTYDEMRAYALGCAQLRPFY